MFSGAERHCPFAKGYGSHCREARCGVEACEQAIMIASERIRTGKVPRYKLKGWTASLEIRRTEQGCLVREPDSSRSGWFGPPPVPGPERVNDQRNSCAIGIRFSSNS